MRQEVESASKLAIAAAKDAFSSAAGDLTTAQAVRLTVVDGLVDAVRQRLIESDKRLVSLDERVTEARLGELVREAVGATSQSVFADKFQPGLDQLANAYDQADSTLVQLQAYTASFVPGGMPIARQTITALEAQRDALQVEVTELRSRVAALDAAAIRQRIETGVDPGEIDRRLQEIQRRDVALADKESLASENSRLTRQVDGLRAEVDKWRGLSISEQSARADIEELGRLRTQVVDAHAAMARAETQRQRAERAEQQGVREIERLHVRLTELAGQEASALERGVRLEALTEQNHMLAKQFENAASEASKLTGQLRTAIEQRDALDRECLGHEERATQAEIGWRRMHAEDHKAASDEVRAELTTWAERTAEARTTAFRAESERLAVELAALRQRLETEVTARRASDLARDHALAETQRVSLESAAVTTAGDRRLALLEAETRLHLERVEASLRADAEGQKAVLVAEGERLKEVSVQDAAEMRQLADQYQQRVDELELRKAELRGEIQGLETTRTTLAEDLETLRNQIDDLRIRAVPDEERVAQLKRPYFTETRNTEAPRENEWLRDVEKGIEGAGFTFHPRLVRAFHTSLKIAHFAPLTVLAGISGTGKSELPRLYADLGGVPFLELAVQPSWDSPNDLFGFFNYTDGRLRAEPLAQLFHQLQTTGDSLKESPVIVLLDEMNLARVEYYFADLLSKLEARRSVRRFEDATARRAASVTMDAGPGKTGIELYLDERVMFVGTMNQDESTLTLSDKVLDRSCLLTFPAPRSLHMTRQNAVPRRASRLSHAAWTSWVQADPAGDDDITRQLNEVNHIMAELDRPFGHRLFRAIHAYLANYPAMGGATSGDHAWSDQYAMKILPRLRGLECQAAAVRRSLDALQTKLPVELQKAFGLARQREFFTWVGAPEIYQDRA